MKKENFKTEIIFMQYEMSAQLPAFVCMNHYFHRLFYMFVYILDISNYKTVSNEKDINNLFN